MAIEDTLFNYGILGCWTLWLLWMNSRQDSRAQERELRVQTVIEANTAAMQKLSDAVYTCPYKK